MVILSHISHMVTVTVTQSHDHIEYGRRFKNNNVT